MNPTKIKLHKSSNTLELSFPEDTGEVKYTLSAEYLRVSSPSAEVRGHSPDQANAQYARIANKKLAIGPAAAMAMRTQGDLLLNS